MKVKRFFASSTREALRDLKAELGADAIVLSNRAVEGGVEILALPPDAIDSLHTPARPPARREMPKPLSERGPDDESDFHVTLSRLAANAVPRNLADGAPRREAASLQRPVIRPFTPPRIDTPERAVPVKKPVKPEKPDAGQDILARKGGGEDIDNIRILQETNTRLMNELAGIRGVIEREFAGFSWYETRAHAPVRARMLGQLLSAGFSPTLSRQLAESIGRDATLESAHEVLRSALGKRLKIASGENEVIDEGGIYALVGPTGVGKTTTVAKLAARFVTRHGTGHLALITTDGYRIGAQEQLRIYGRILGVPVFSVRDAAELRQTLLDLRGKRLVLIDTMGMNQRDRMVMAQASMLSEAGAVRRLLLLNATCRGDTLDDVVKSFAGPEVAGCILTKVDEAVSLAPAIDTALRHELDVRYIANGQRVPEDLHLPSHADLLQRALRPPSDEALWQFDNDATGAMLSAGGA
ncbi:MAG: flagellar biosynthesis protein FlhF [Azoarcus sp.]|jgi:flagellar biosynthesis protein FlhF|nr:flagellar biosynthesis protein FlhF [Azoarcus sp.]